MPPHKCIYDRLTVYVGNTSPYYVLELVLNCIIIYCVNFNFL